MHYLGAQQQKRLMSVQSTLLPAWRLLALEHKLLPVSSLMTSELRRYEQAAHSRIQSLL